MREYVVGKLEDKRGYALNAYARAIVCMISLVISFDDEKTYLQPFVPALNFSVIERHKTEKQLSEEGSPFPSPGRSLSESRK